MFGFSKTQLIIIIVAAFIIGYLIWVYGNYCTPCKIRKIKLGLIKATNKEDCEAAGKTWEQPMCVKEPCPGKCV